MSLDNNTQPNRAVKFNAHLKGVLDFYRSPLIKALRILNKEHKYSTRKIAKDIFDNQLSPEAVNLYLKKGLMEESHD